MNRREAGDPSLLLKRLLSPLRFLHIAHAVRNGIRLFVDE